jgi:hypothetical protein
VAQPYTAEELEAQIAQADDKERMIGLIAAPVAALIGFLVLADLTTHASKSNQGEYHALTFVLLGLSLAILGLAYFRKRLFLGIALALYGLAIFNLKYWGFGVPFLLVGSWYLVRAYRLNQQLKVANGDTGRDRRPAPPTNGSRPSPNKRYTPPTAKTKRSSVPKPGNEQAAG